MQTQSVGSKEAGDALHMIFTSATRYKSGKSGDFVLKVGILVEDGYKICRAAR